MDVGVGKSVAKIGNLIIEKGPLEVAVGNRPSVYDAAPCGLKTCKFMGGQLECADCSVGTEGRRKGPCPKTCPGDPICPLATERKLRRTGKRRVPLFKRLAKQGTKPKMECTQVYPGYKIGHRECCVPYFFVPPKMGWLWNIHTPCLNLKPRRGWRPGAVTRTVAKAIIKHRKAQNNYPFENNQKKGKKRNDDSEPKLICPKPTLEVKKREGAYFITMNPLKDPNTLQQNENPYLDVTPMQFKVEKNNANDPDCICTDEGEYYKSDCSSNSEFEIEVTTPAGIIHPDRPIKKKEVVVKQTQYDRRDIPPAEKGKAGKKERKAKKEKKIRRRKRSSV
ncbi:hypothetical protein WA026_005095 [Henosepilachna vigintioctopunctata]|uniref:DUF4776 domain-containing protein n=1 Tax=Henosepilachna vigintioctopunctata TaxID=420089 RepID=A0AAW1UX28_9CUCU